MQPTSDWVDLQPFTFSCTKFVIYCKGNFEAIISSYHSALSKAVWSFIKHLGEVFKYDVALMSAVKRSRKVMDGFNEPGITVVKTRLKKYKFMLTHDQEHLRCLQR